MKFLIAAVALFWEYILEHIWSILIIAIILYLIGHWFIWERKNKMAQQAEQQGGFNEFSGEALIMIKRGKPHKKIADVIKETVRIRTAIGHGSGFIVDSRKHGCLIITNNHVIDDHEHVEIVHHDGKEEYGRVERWNADIDIALISFPNKYKKRGVAIAQQAPDAGDEVFAIGSPLHEQYSHSVSKGIISAVDRVVDGKKYIQSDVTINPGNSGGPLISSSNEVIGVTVSGMSGGDGLTSLGVNHFIPIPQAMVALSAAVFMERGNQTENYFEIWRSAMELLKNHINSVAEEISPSEDEEGDGYGIRFEDFDQLVGYETYASLCSGKGAENIKFFRIDFVSSESTARYLFFFDCASRELKQCGVTLHIAREEPPNSPNYKKLSDINTSDVLDFHELGYDPESEEFVLKRKNSTQQYGMVEFVGEFFEEVGDKHFSE